MKSFAFLAARPVTAAGIRANEFESVKRFGGLADDEIEYVDLELNPTVNLDDYQAVFLSGSQYGFKDDRETMTEQQRLTERLALELTSQAIERDFPFLGLCYGHQAIAVASGLDVTEEYFEKMSIVNIEVTEAGREDQIFGQLPENFYVVLGHSESIGELPANSVVLASSELCPVQAIRVKNNVYGTQFHPEIDRYGLEVRIDYYGDSKYAKPEEIDQIRASADRVELTGGAKLIRTFVDHYRQKG